MANVKISPPFEWTHAGASKLLEYYEHLFETQAVDEILSAFTEDVHVDYSGTDPFVGRDKLRGLLKTRFAKLKDYRLKKKVEYLSDSKMAASWKSEWIDIPTGRRMRGAGVEVLTREGQLYTHWVASFHGWQI